MQALLEEPIEVNGDDVDASIRAAQRGIRDGDQRLSQASVYQHASGNQLSALPDPRNVGRWISVIIRRDKSVEELPGRCSTERDAMQVALAVIEGR